MFHGWDNFNMLVGTAAGTLIGLLFIAMTLTAGFERSQALRGAALYMTPTMVHFAVVLTAAAAAVAPRLPAVWVAAVLALGALAGLGNGIRSWVGILGLHREQTTPPHWTDLWCYAVAPAAIYLVFAGAAWRVAARDPQAPLLLAGCEMALLLLAVRNAWDMVTWMAPGRAPESPPPQDRGASTPSARS